MTDNKILNIFEEFKQNYSLPKSSEVDRVVTFFCLYINKQDIKIQEQFKFFFIKELATNTHNNQDWAVDVLMKLSDKKMIPEIYPIFLKDTQEDGYKKGRIFLLLMALNDCDINHIPVYYDYIEKNVKKQLFLHQDAFFLSLLFDYLVINPQHSLEILSDYYAKFISAMTKRNESNIFIPCKFFSHNSCRHLNDLLIMTYRKNHQSGLSLQKLFMDYAEHSPLENREEWNNMQNMILHLKSIILNGAQ